MPSNASAKCSCQVHTAAAAVKKSWASPYRGEDEHLDTHLRHPRDWMDLVFRPELALHLLPVKSVVVRNDFAFVG